MSCVRVGMLFPAKLERNMNLALLLTIGGLVGWVCALIDQDCGKRQLSCAVGSGMTGSLLTGLVVAPFLSQEAIASSGLSAFTLVLAPLGAALVVTLTIVLQRGALR